MTRPISEDRNLFGTNLIIPRYLSQVKCLKNMIFLGLGYENSVILRWSRRPCR